MLPRKNNLKKSILTNITKKLLLYNKQRYSFQDNSKIKQIIFNKYIYFASFWINLADFLIFLTFFNERYCTQNQIKRSIKTKIFGQLIKSFGLKLIETKGSLNHETVLGQAPSKIFYYTTITNVAARSAYMIQ